MPCLGISAYCIQPSERMSFFKNGYSRIPYSYRWLLRNIKKKNNQKTPTVVSFKTVNLLHNKLLKVHPVNTTIFNYRRAFCCYCHFLETSPNVILTTLQTSQQTKALPEVSLLCNSTAYFTNDIDYSLSNDFSNSGPNFAFLTYYTQTHLWTTDSV